VLRRIRSYGREKFEVKKREIRKIFDRRKVSMVWHFDEEIFVSWVSKFLGVMDVMINISE
jgi:hypothetical protein